MKCSVCGTESKGDARFCSGCGATLIVPTYDKTMLLDVRAFRAAQSGEIPVVQSPRQAAPAVAPPAAPAAAPVPRPGRSNKAGLVLLLFLLGVLAYLLYQLAMSFGLLPTFFASRTAPRPAAATPVGSGTKVVPEIPKAAPKAPGPAPAAAPPADAGVPKDASAPPRQAAALAAAPEPPLPDRLQALNDVLAGCARENSEGRAVCERRARLQFCNGYWGKVPQCPDSRDPNPGK
jgi:hypothetical protein